MTKKRITVAWTIESALTLAREFSKTVHPLWSSFRLDHRAAYEYLKRNKALDQLEKILPKQERYRKKPDL